MKTNPKRAFALLCSIVLVGCAEDAVVSPTTDYEEGAGNVSTLNANIDAVNTKVSMNDTGEAIDIEWKNNDAISIFQGDTFICDFVCTDASKNRFESSYSLEKGEYIAVYPATQTLEGREDISETTQTNNSSIAHLEDVIRLKGELSYDPVLSNNSLKLSHEAALLKITFAAADDSKTPDHISVTNGSTSYRLNFEQLEVSDTYTSYMMINPCDAYSRELKFVVYYTDGDLAIYKAYPESAYVAGKCYLADITTLDEVNALGWNGGGEEWPYYISSPESLLKIAYEVNNNGETYQYKTFEVTADIDLGGEANGSWTPIGGSSVSFLGTIKGKGHTISGLYINTTSTTHVGLFGSIQYATISDLHLTGEVTATNSSLVGGFVGDAWDAVFNNCTTSVNVVATSAEWKEKAGGFAGSGGKCTFTGCSSTGDVSGVSITGGLVGNADQATLFNCYTTGNVTSSQNHTGGLTGTGSTLTITNCYTSGDVTGQMKAAGIHGSASEWGDATATVTINNCIASGNITGIGSVGGVIGSLLLGDGKTVVDNSITESYYRNDAIEDSNEYGTGIDNMNSTDFLDTINETTGLIDDAYQWELATEYPTLVIPAYTVD